MFLFGKSRRQDKNALRSGTVEREVSRMMAVPRNPGGMSSQEAVLTRLRDTDEITILSGEELPVRLSYRGYEYELHIGDIELSVDPDDSLLGSLGERERAQVLSAKKALVTEMLFADNNMDSYHLQVKMMDMLMPDMAALMDVNAYRIHSGRWVSMTARSRVAPSPEYMFVVHCVSDDDDAAKSRSVWIHTHGLTRCGTIELEIIGATEENYTLFATALNQMAHYLVGENRFIDELEPLRIGVRGDGKDILVTWQRSEWSFRDFPKSIIGGPEDRDEEHSASMGVVYVYDSEKNAENGKITPIVKWEQQLGDNDIYFKTTDETRRMRALAQERLGYLRDIYEQCPQNETLVKIALVPDAKHQMNAEWREYIWFQVDEMREDGFSATLIQDAFYVEGMTKGVHKDDFSYEEIVDWSIETPDATYEPNNVFRYLPEE